MRLLGGMNRVGTAQRLLFPDAMQALPDKSHIPHTQETYSACQDSEGSRYPYKGSCPALLHSFPCCFRILYVSAIVAKVGWQQSFQATINRSFGAMYCSAGWWCMSMARRLSRGESESGSTGYFVRLFSSQSVTQRVSGVWLCLTK